MYRHLRIPLFVASLPVLAFPPYTSHRNLEGDPVIGRLHPVTRRALARELGLNETAQASPPDSPHAPHSTCADPGTERA
jgi:hypothetical protein